MGADAEVQMERCERRGGGGIAVNDTSPPSACLRPRPCARRTVSLPTCLSSTTACLDTTNASDLAVFKRPRMSTSSLNSFYAVHHIPLEGELTPMSKASVHPGHIRLSVHPTRISWHQYSHQSSHATQNTSWTSAHISLYSI